MYTPGCVPRGLGHQTSQPIFGKVLLEVVIFTMVFQGLLVCKPFLSCTLEHAFRLSEDVLELLFNARKTALKGFLFGLQVGARESVRRKVREQD
jgi:hypothetical protein